MILGEVIDYLVTTFAAATEVPVYDGPVPTAANAAAFVLVGATGDDEDGASAMQEPSTLGPGIWRDETGEVVCAVRTRHGGTDLSARRAEALAAASACIDAVHADRRLGGLLADPTAVTSGVRYQSVQTDQGAVARVVFTVAYVALIE